MSLTLTKSEMLGNVEIYNDIINNLPIGIVIFSQEIQLSKKDYIISNSNQLGRKLLSIPKDNNINQFIKSLNNYQELSLSQNKNETSLYNHIFETKDSSNKTFIHNNNILYIKVRRNKNNIYVIIDNYEDERKNIQSQFVKNIGYQYLLTLYHEINNPVNSLISTINDIGGNINSNCTKRIDLLVSLIRFFLKNFILYFQISTLNLNEKLNPHSTINLETIFDKISEKFLMLFEYKRISQNENFTLLSNKCTNFDYFYFKNLIKMIYIYFYKTIPKEGNFLVNVESTNEKNILKITFSKNKINERTRSYSNAEIINFETLNVSNLSSKIQTQKMTESIIKQLIEILKIQSEYNFDNKNNYIIIYIPIENEIKFGNEEELDELSADHLDTMRLLGRSVTAPTMDNTSKNDIFENEVNSNNFSSEDSISNSSKSSCSISKNNNNNNNNNNIKDRNKNENDSNDNESEYYDLNVISPKRNFNKRFGTFQTNIKGNFKFNNRLSTGSNFDMIKKMQLRRRKTVLELLKKNYFLKENVNNKFFSKQFNKKILPNNNLIDKLNNSRHHSMFQLRNIKEKDKDKDKNKQKEIILEEEKSLNKSLSAMTLNQYNLNKSNIIKNKLNINEYRLNLEKEIPLLKKSSAYLTKKIKNEIFTNPNIKINDIQNEIKIKNIPTLNITNSNEKKENENCCNDLMIVDDEQFNVSCLSNNLKKLNILCDSCSDGIECLNLINKRLEKKCNCSKKNYKLILMDLIMPKMNGIEAVKHIQEMVNENKIDDKYLNVVFISANVDQKDSLIDIQKKYPVVKGFLTKPVKITKIKDMLKRFYYE